MKVKNFERKFVIAFWIMIVIGLIFALLSAIFFMCGNDLAGTLGIVSTILSLILSFVSIIYTYVSGKQTLKTITTIKEQNDSLVEEIRRQLRKDNYNDNNLDNI